MKKWNGHDLKLHVRWDQIALTFKVKETSHSSKNAFFLQNQEGDGGCDAQK